MCEQFLTIGHEYDSAGNNLTVCDVVRSTIVNKLSLAEKEMLSWATSCLALDILLFVAFSNRPWFSACDSMALISVFLIDFTIFLDGKSIFLTQTLQRLL